MNRRIVLIDSSENYLRFCGKLLNCEFVIDNYDSLSVDVCPDVLKDLGPGDGVLIVGSKPFSYLRNFYHYGIRSENFADCQLLRRLSIEGGAFVKCVSQDCDDDVLKDFLDSSFAIPKDFSWYQHIVVHEPRQAMEMLNYFDNLPLTTAYGFDYEASGMPLDPWFEISGASICTTQYGAFLSFTDLRHTCTSQEQYQSILDKLREFLLRHMSNIWVYNMQYEFQVSHRMLKGVDLYNLCDASVFNVIDGYHEFKKYSLKWTSNRVLESTVWDTEFDRISDLVDSMLFEETGKLKRDKKKVLKVDQSTFKSTPEWAELCKRYPNYVDEFERLILEYWGNPFMCIPSDILGYYCNLDAFYTLMIYEARKDMYTEDCIQTALDNTRLGCRLHVSGLYINEDFRLKYKEESEKLMAWGITYCATARCYIKMNKHNSKMADIKKYPEICQKLLKENKFFGGNYEEIVKYLLSSNIDTLDTTTYGLNEGGMVMKYGASFASSFLNLLVQAMKDAGMIKDKTDRKTKVTTTIITKIDDGVVRKKKLISLLAQSFEASLGFTIKSQEKHIELEKYLYYERAYDELRKISSRQLVDIGNIPQRIYAFGQKFTILEYSDFISENYFKCKSPIENNEICKEFAELSRSESAFLAAIFESTQQLNNAEKFYSTLGIQTVEDAFNHFGNEYNQVAAGTLKIEDSSYPEKMFNLFNQYYKDIESDSVKEVWSNFNGYIAQEQFFKYVSDQYLEYEKPFDVVDLGNNFFFMRKMVINYLLYKKYAKVLSTYIEGMFKANNRWVIEGPDRIPLRYAEPGEPGAVEKCFVHYEVNTKSSKRWSSGFHTILSHADLKDCIAVPPAYNENGNIVYGGSENVLTYFDIKY